MSTIHYSQEYSKFKFCETRNRDLLSPSHQKHLEESLLKLGWSVAHPMLCNKDYYILDGQNRFEIAKKHKLRIPYVIDPDISFVDIPTLQCGRPWVLKDYLKIYSNQGLQPYNYIKNICDKYQMPINIFIKCLTRCRAKTSAGYLFKTKKCELKYQCKNQNELICSQWNEIMHTIKEKKDMLKTKFYLSMNAKCCLLMTIQYSSYSHSKMLEVLDKRPREIFGALKQQSSEDIMIGLKTAYNKGMPKNSLFTI